MNNIIRKKQLLRFLKEYNCYKIFIDNLNNKEISYSNNINEIINKYYNSEIINAFDWQNSNEGFAYWFFINSDWKKLLKIQYEYC